jgi:membrane associated rhomboid family serine protease
VFPIRDENPRVHPPVATIVIIVLNVLAWVLLQGLGTESALTRSICLYGLIPGDLLSTAAVGTQLPMDHGLVCVLDRGSSWSTVISSMFMHGGWFHLIGNMWFLWIFGDNVEDAMGPIRFVTFYLLCGLAAAAAQIFANPTSIVPMVGASGVLGYWFILQIVSGLPGLVGEELGGGVAFWAHVGGFVAGLSLALLFRQRARLDARLHSPPRQTARHRW